MTDMSFNSSQNIVSSINIFLNKILKNTNTFKTVIIYISKNFKENISIYMIFSKV